MPEETFEGSLTATVIETTEKPFIPKKQVEIRAVLEPLEAQEATFYDPDYVEFYKTITPPYLPEYGKLPQFETTGNELIINIETTGVKPWESRVICIGVMDPNTLEPQALNFIEETEEQTIRAFLEWWENTTYSELIGYNVSFDYRFLYVLMQKYRLSAPRWPELNLYDLMQQQKQVKDKFVYGRNPEGKLEDWATYLLGAKPYAPQKMIYAWLKEGNIDEIVNFNSDKIVKAYYLWVLDKMVKGNIPGEEILGRPGSETVEEANPGETNPGNPVAEKISVKCSECLQEQEMLKTDKVINCSVCETPIPNPGL